MTKQRHILVTGAAGFIGSNFVRIALENNYCVTGLDSLSYAGQRSTIDHLKKSDKFRFCHDDIGNNNFLASVVSNGHQTELCGVVNFAAETHVDRSIEGPRLFYETNVLGTHNLIQSLIKSDICSHDFRFVHISTDEVFGSISKGEFDENSPYRPNSPYAASKAAADHVVRASAHTFGFPAIVTNCSNNFGPFQFPEKLVPLTIIRALQNKNLPVFGDGKQVRDWLYVEDHCDAILRVFESGIVNETYMIGASNQKNNISVVETICDILEELEPPGHSNSYRKLITFVADRPGHDTRYAVNADKIRTKLGWEPKTSFENGLKQTVKWYLSNAKWWNKIIKESYNLERLGSKNSNWLD